MSLPRFIGEKEGNYLILKDQECNHAVKVLRVKQNDLIEINTLDGNFYLAKVEDISKNQLIALPIEKIPIKEEEFKITLYQCMPNQLSKIDEIIEPLSQLGVYKLVPVISKNSAVKEQDVNKKLEKWQRKALNSIKQCKRPFPLIIEKPIKLYNIKSNDELKVVFYEKEKQNKVKKFMNKTLKTVSVFIGNEGGFKEEEIEYLKKGGFVPLSLGDHILKMETAIIIGICQIKCILEN